VKLCVSSNMCEYASVYKCVYAYVCMFLYLRVCVYVYMCVCESKCVCWDPQQANAFTRHSAEKERKANKRGQLE
jgi:hypothetical protein